MFEIVWFIIICAWVVIAIKKRSTNMQGRNNSNGSSTTVPMHKRQTTIPNVPNAVETPQIKQRETSAPKYQKAGDQVIASRLMEGDAVPGGCRKMVCGYCGAANLVPEYGREKYICYFCRERL